MRWHCSLNAVKKYYLDSGHFKMPLVIILQKSMPYLGHHDSELSD
jgi:hypothetical protein